jgi:hypothetical protein
MTLLPIYLAYAIALSAGLALAGHRARAVSSRVEARTRPTRVLIVGATAAAAAAAMRVQEAVLSTLGHKRFFGPSRILSEGTRNILRAMDGHGVRRLVCTTSLGIGDSGARLRQGRGAGNPLWTVRVSRADVAAFMLDQLESDTHLRAAPGVCW